VRITTHHFFWWGFAFSFFIMLYTQSAMFKSWYLLMNCWVLFDWNGATPGYSNRADPVKKSVLLKRPTTATLDLDWIFIGGKFSWEFSEGGNVIGSREEMSLGRSFRGRIFQSSDWTPSNDAVGRHNHWTTEVFHWYHTRCMVMHTVTPPQVTFRPYNNITRTKKPILLS
jgi:hypothetical protein